LIDQINQLKQENEELKNHINEQIQQLERKNQQLREQQIEQMQQLKKENDELKIQLSKQSQQMEEENQKFRITQTEQIQQLKQENEELKNQNNEQSNQIEEENEQSKNQQTELILQMKQEIEELKNPFLKGKMISYQNPHQGILQDLERSEPNPFTFSCSSVYDSSHKPETILNYDNSTFFVSQDQPNSWFCIKLNTKQIILSGYLLRSWGGTTSNNLKSWKLECSKDNANWIVIDKQIEELKNPFLKGKTISYQNPHQGILQDVERSEPNPFTFSCSSVCGSSYKPETMLNYDNSTYFASQNQPNSLFCIKLNAKQIILSGYLLRSYSGVTTNNIESWKLECSKDNSNWIVIDKQIERNWITQDWSEVYFPVQAKEAFSYFKFTQIGQNYLGYNHFELNYLEFFGAILDQ
jgi:hypothetical protein